MSQKDVMGREPVSRVTIVQDKCSRSWADGTCKAGLTNYLPNSADLTDTDFWTTSIFDSVAAQTDAGQFDGATFHAFTSLATSATSYIVHAAKTTPGVLETHWHSIYYRLDNVASFTFSRFLTSGALAEIQINSAHEVTLTTNGIENATIQTIEQSGEPNWYRLQFSIASGVLADIENPFSIAVVPDNTAADMVFYVYAPDFSNREDALYIETSGTPIVADSVIECINTRKTCQDPDNYDKTTLPLKFVKSRSRGLRDDYYIPSLNSVSISPAKVNPGGAEKSTSALGQRATISASFIDHPHNDKVVDPYVNNRDYDPLMQGTFWSKWLARNPYYLHRPILFESGYLVDGAMVDITSRYFVITSVDGPSSDGEFRISGKDILTLAENSKAQAPRASRGKLGENIGAGSGAGNSFDLTPSGIGDIDYPASGYLRIEKEVIAFTRSGDTITPTSRGQFGTDSTTHDTGATAQLCLQYASETVADIFYDLLNVYSGIPDGFLDKTNWDLEIASFLPQLYSALITEPVGVSTLIGELCEEAGVSIWWDERTSLVKMRSVRSAQDDTITDITDSNHIIKDSVSWRDLTDQLTTQIWVHYGRLNPTEKMDQTNNYAAVEVVGNFDAESANKYGQQKIKQIFSRWIAATGTAAANEVAQRLVNRLSQVPKEVTFRVDAKDGNLWLGDFIRMSNRLQVDIYGNKRLSNLQIYQGQEVDLGSQFQYTAQEFFLTVPEDPDTIEIPIAVNLLNVNLREIYNSERGADSLTGTETVRFIVRSGVVLGGDTAGGGVNVPVGARDASNDFYDGGTMLSSSAPVGLIPILQKNDISVVTTTLKGDRYRLYPSDPSAVVRWDVIEYPISTAFNTGTWPIGVTLDLVIESGAYVVGEAGAGLCHTTLDGPSGDLDAPIHPGHGGDAMTIDHPISITNNGIISAGGGGGFGGLIFFGTSQLGFVPGGGGAGSLSRTVDRIQVGLSNQQTDASAGSLNDGGLGGTARILTLGRYRNYNMDGDIERRGCGGDLAQEGQDMVYKPDGFPIEYKGLGGQPGKAIKSGANLITWITQGDVRGAMDD